MQKAVEDFIGYAAYDAIKEKGLPGTPMLIEDVSAPVIFHYVIKPMISPWLDRWMGTFDPTLKDELIKFLGEFGGLSLTRMLMKEDDYKGAALKQVISQAGVFGYRKATNQI